MPKVSTKRKQNAEKPDNSSIFDHFAAQNQPLEADVAEVKAGPTTEELLAQITALNSRVEQAEKTNIALMTQPVVQNNPQPQMNQPVKEEELPDPTLDPNGYAKAVRDGAEKRIQQFMDNQRQAQQQTQQNDNASKDLWSEFSGKYADYAENQDRVEFAASQVIKKLKTRNIDVARYMTSGRDKFMSEVVAEMDKVFGKPDADAEPEPEADANRTAGIFGGLESGGKPAKGTQNQPGDMIKDLHDMQKKTGFY